MKSNYLHITNGDTTTAYLKKRAFKGAFITWREMLCEGKTITDVGSEKFWKTRFEFLKTSYKITKKRFIDYTLKEYRNLCKQKEQEEIVLWFEYDLFCQINMLAVISWLKKYRKGYKITLVTSGKIAANNSKMYGLAELTPEQLQDHYKNRITLSQDDIEYADYIWQLYCANSPLRLQNIQKLNPNSPFAYLEEAIKAHLLRFPSIDNGLNFVEQHIIQTANQEKFETKEKMVAAILANQENYGFGDTQYFQKIKKLKMFFSSLNPVVLNKKGKQVLENQLNCYRQLHNDDAYLGGAKKYSYLYVNTTEKLLQITS